MTMLELPPSVASSSSRSLHHDEDDDLTITECQHSFHEHADDGELWVFDGVPKNPCNELLEEFPSSTYDDLDDDDKSVATSNSIFTSLSTVSFRSFRSAPSTTRPSIRTPPSKRSWGLRPQSLRSLGESFRWRAPKRNVSQEENKEDLNSPMEVTFEMAAADTFDDSSSSCDEDDENNIIADEEPPTNQHDSDYPSSSSEDPLANLIAKLSASSDVYKRRIQADSLLPPSLLYDSDTASKRTSSVLAPINSCNAVTGAELYVDFPLSATAEEDDEGRSFSETESETSSEDLGEAKRSGRWSCPVGAL